MLTFEILANIIYFNTMQSLENISQKGSAFMQSTIFERPTLTVQEAASLIGVSAPTMYDITERADFSALIRVGRKKLILREKFLAWLELQTER